MSGALGSDGNSGSERSFAAQALDPARSVVVSACAGSGKTWLLVSRIVRALLDGAKPGEILAITFTRKAAREMQARLRLWLKQLAIADDDTVMRMLREREVPAARAAALLPAARGLYETLLTAELPISITTFHSWFLQLSRRAPLDAGVGDAALSEETAALIDEAWQRFASAASGDVAAALDYLYTHYGPDNARRALMNMLARRGDWWIYAESDTEPGAESVMRALAALGEDMPAAPDDDIPAALAADPLLAAELCEFAALLQKNNTVADSRCAEALLAAPTFTDPAAWLRQVTPAFFTSNGSLRQRKPSAAQAKRMGAEAAARYLQIHQAVGARLEAATQAIAWQRGYRFNRAVLTCGVQLIATYQGLKQERRVIDYTDIEWRAHQLLGSGEHAVYLMCKLDARYRHVLLDEFQDTNPVQWQTLRCWFDAAAEADARPSIFMVGDPKQSIYRFRRAEARLFDEATAYLELHFGAATLSLDTSRRCAPAVIEAVNRVFEAEAGFTGFRRHGAYHTGAPGCVEALPLAARDDDEDTESAHWRNPFEAPLVLTEDSRRQREAQQLAERIHAMVTGGAAPLWIAADDGGAVGRPARYGDVMILVRRRSHLAVYEEALRHLAVPYVTSRQGGLLDALEVRDLLALLEFLVSPFDDLKLAHALRSPVFSCSDGDLVTLAHAVRGGFSAPPMSATTWWLTLTALPESALSPALLRARRLLAQWLAHADALPVHDQLDRIYFQADVLARYDAAVPQALRGAVAANLRALMRRALDADAGRYMSLPRFVADLAQLRDAPAVEAPDEGMVGDAGDAVRIHTVHGAKGLEAPIVWLPDAAAGGSPAANRGYEVLLDWEAGAARPAHFSMYARRDEQTPLQRAIFDREGDYAQREDLNLLYVAMTRARQVLIASGIEARGRDGNWHDKLAVALQATPLQMRAPGPDDYPRCEAPVVGTAVGDSCPADPRLAQPLPTGTRNAPPETVEAAGAGRQGILQGILYGTLFHALMERLTQSPPIEAATLQHLLGVPAAQFESLWRDARRVLDDSAYRRYFDAACYQRADNEVAFVTAAGDTLRIDRLVEFADEVWVLDYKSGSLAHADADMLKSYEAQVARYCVHITPAYPAQRVRGLIIFSGGGSIGVTAESSTVKDIP